MRRITYLIAFIIIVNFSRVSAQPDSILIKKVASLVSPDSALDNLECLTGDKETVIDGETYVIKSRHNTNNGNHKAARYLYQKFSEYGYNPEIRHYGDYKYKDYPTSPAENVYAVSIGDENPEKYIVICAHYDCESDSLELAPGADDNASGVGAVMEAARVVKKLRHKYTVIFALFDHEEFGPMGSYNFADSLFAEGITDLKCINVDMIGYHPEGSLKTMVYYDTSHFSQDIANIILNVSQQINVKPKFEIADFYLIMDSVKNKIMKGLSDEIAFRSNNYQAVLIAQPLESKTRNPYYHTRNDRAKNFNLPYYFDNIRLCVAATAAAAGVYEIKGAPEAPELNLSELIISPNPAGQYISLIDSQLNPDEKIEIYSLYGLKAIEAKGSQIVNVEDLPAGSYIIRAGGRTGRFVKI